MAVGLPPAMLRTRRVRSVAGCLLWLWLVAPAWAAPGSGPRDPNELYRKGVALHQAGDAAGAIPYYLEVLKTLPKSVEVRSNLGAAYAQIGHYEDAIEQYHKALELRPDLAQVRHNLALALYKTDRIPEAAAEFETVVKQTPKNTAAPLMLADCYLKMGEPQKVIDILSPLQAELGEDHLFAYLLGTALIARNEIERGQQVIDRLFRGGDSAEGHLLLGAQYLTAGDSLKAQPELEKALALNPDLPTAHALYAQALRQNRDHEGAAREFREEIKRNPNDFDSNFWLGLLCREENRLDEAMTYLDRAARLRPDSTAVAFALGKVHLTANRLPEARAQIEKVVRDAPGYQPAHVLLGQIYYRLGLKELGDQQRAIVQKLRTEEREKQLAAESAVGPTNFGDEGSSATNP